MDPLHGPRLRKILSEKGAPYSEVLFRLCGLLHQSKAILYCRKKMSLLSGARMMPIHKECQTHEIEVFEGEM